MGKHNKPRSEEHKRRIAEALKGKVRSPEHRLHLSESKLGTHQSEELRAKRRLLVAGEGNPFFAKHHSAETREKLAEAHRGTSPRLSRYGVTPEQYTAELQAGNRWCFFRRHFAPASTFTNKKGLCEGCKTDHNRVQDLRKKFGITPEQFEAMFDAQGRVCGICGSTATGRRNNHMAVDHNHKTASVRGILCHRCNTAIERIENIEGWTLRALNYLSKYSSMEQANAG